MIGDGYCDDRFNLPLEGCGFDGGDCCGPKVNTLFCEHCLCLDEIIVSEDECRHEKVCKIRFQFFCTQICYRYFFFLAFGKWKM